MQKKILSDQIYWEVPQSEDGRFVVVKIMESETEQLWLIDAKKGNSKLLAEGAYVEGDITSDGAWVAYSVDICEEKCQPVVYIYEVRTGETVEVGPGTMPVWMKR